jgi:hypothetical protein
MKFLIILILSLFLILSISKAQVVDVNIKEVTRVETTRLDYNSSIADGKPFKLNIELFNSGSIGYKNRVRLDIFDKDNLIFTGWSEENDFFPGNRKMYDLYWYPSDYKGKFKASIRIYYANEIDEIKKISLDVKPFKKSPESIFEIIDFKTYEDEIVLLLKANKTVENIIVVQSNYPTGWIFEQYKINKLGKGDIKIINLKYEPTLWKDSNVIINIFTEDGKYYTSKSFTLIREPTSWKYFYGIINDLRVFLKV